ncbi:hypothetical protein E4U43_001032 [Claviceps pusilla]|uniref:Uncharacterized protein n=1 Tax=Claviceps pusilla TaxID=123648 RepID=A0A9P7N8J7_9HYPO|nr:hypothetical protein E4U43_001032 [Claviceps pusilla]
MTARGQEPYLVMTHGRVAAKDEGQLQESAALFQKSCAGKEYEALLPGGRAAQMWRRRNEH